MIIAKTAAIAFLVATASLASGCSTRDDDRYGYSGRHHSDRETAQVSFDFGTVGSGYNDGYWDNGHEWHNWDNDNQRDSYRHRDGSHYSDWNHDRDGDNNSRGH